MRTSDGMIGTNRPQACDGAGAELLAAAEALLEAKDNDMVTVVHWRRMRGATKAMRKHKESQR